MFNKIVDASSVLVDVNAGPCRGWQHVWNASNLRILLPDEFLVFPPTWSEGAFRDQKLVVCRLPLL